MQLKGSKTHDNLKAAFAGESQANRRYLYFAAKADVEGQNDVSALFRSTAEKLLCIEAYRESRLTQAGTFLFSQKIFFQCNSYSVLLSI